jgi:O-acetyl-ADP-ribose deacetylase (regulator of RNase III)
MPLEIIHGDLTKVRADAIVNAANNALRMGGGVCGAIFAAAGAKQLQAACDRIGCCETGKAVITDGYALPARYVIHTVGPVWRGGGQGEEELLRACYKNSLELAKQHGLRSVAFPLISSGIFGYPREMAMQAAVGAINVFLQDNDMTVVLVLF